MTRQILLIGSSVRAAAQSAVRCGWHPLAIDQFADLDLRALCPAHRVDSYPQGVIGVAARLPACPVVYTGAFENHPDELRMLESERPIWGNRAEIVQAVRDPHQLHDTLARRGLRMPEVRFAHEKTAHEKTAHEKTAHEKTAHEKTAQEKTAHGDWLLKPYRSGGGLGIRTVSLGRVIRSPSKSHYLQRRIQGMPMSALFLGCGGQATLIAATRQLIGCDWAGAKSFWYVGNVGPHVAPPPVAEEFSRIGQAVADAYQLVGLFGVDLIVSGSEVWTLEVNPRYTAAVEILERGLDLPLFQFHVDACHNKASWPARIPLPAEPVQHGKAIIYSHSNIIVPEEFTRWFADRSSDFRFPAVADLPAVGAPVQAGEPLCTIFASGATGSEVIDSLRRTAIELMEWLARFAEPSTSLAATRPPAESPSREGA